MIQRIQSVYLLLAGLAQFLLFLPTFGFYSVDVDASKNTIAALSDGIYSATDNGTLSFLMGMGGALAILSIFLFRKRLSQARLCWFGIALCLVLVALAIYFFGQVSQGQTVSNIHYKLGFGLPLIAALFYFLANRSIMKDEDLVQSSNRLR